MDDHELTQAIDVITLMILDLYTNQVAILQLLQDSKPPEHIRERILAARLRMDKEPVSQILSKTDSTHLKRAAAMLKHLLTDSPY